jgi:hypothetical protein
LNPGHGKAHLFGNSTISKPELYSRRFIDQRREPQEIRPTLPIHMKMQ